MPTRSNSGSRPKNHLPRLATDIARDETAKHSTTLATAFSRFAAHVAEIVGTPYAFIAAIAVLFVWALCGPMLGFSDTWQLIINTGTTIVTFLIVFLIQNTQNRDAKSIHLKLNELVYALKGAHNELIEVEKLTDEELKRLDEYYARVREECERRKKKKRSA